MEAKLLTKILLKNAPANEIFAVDLNGDRQLELLCLKSMGTNQRSNRQGQLQNRLRDKDCLTAIDLEGQILWQLGNPPAFADAISCFTHCPDQQVWCEDIDEDGKIEVMFLTRRDLLILEGATGRIKRKLDLPLDHFAAVRGFSTVEGKRLLINGAAESPEGYRHGDPTLIFDSDLNQLAEIPFALGSGHSPRACDINNDGNDELLIGYEAFDTHGNKLWTLEGVIAEGFDDADMHVDQVQVGLFEENRDQLRIVYAGSRWAYMARPDGSLVWKRELGHPQHILIGDFLHGGKDRHIAFLNHLKQNSINFVNEEGRTLNIISPLPFWPENPHLQESGRQSHSGEGILIYPKAFGDGSDGVIVRDWGWPRIFNMRGVEPFVLPHPAKYQEPANRPKHEFEDISLNSICPGLQIIPRESYGVQVADVDNDGLAEIIVHNLQQLWIFKPPLEINDEMRQAHQRLKPVTGQGHYAVAK